MDTAAHEEVPWIVNLELTNACNLTCVFCDHPVFVAGGMTFREMEPALLERALLGLGDGTLHELGLVGLGEPTLDRSLVEHLAVIERFAGRFERISINSNLVSLKASVARDLLTSPITAYTFSLNASNRRTYETLMGRDCFDLAIANLRTFLSLRKSLGSDTSVSVQLLSSPENSLDELRRLVPERDGVRFFTRAIYTKPAIRAATVRKRFPLMGQGSPPLEVHRPTATRRYPCWDLYTRIYLDVDGNVYPCTIGNDSYRAGSGLHLGTIREMPLLDLFNNERMQRARRVALEGHNPFPECERCNVWSLTPNNFHWDEDLQRWIRREKPVRAYGLKQ
jgi:radical SAM protein with 4Fe4S-binding SPASM domain